MLHATDDAIRLDLELDLAAKGEAPRQCSACRGWGYGETCPCSPDRFLDPVRQLVAEKGDDITDEDMDRIADAVSGGAAADAEGIGDCGGGEHSSLPSRLFGPRQ